MILRQTYLLFLLLFIFVLDIHGQKSIELKDGIEAFNANDYSKAIANFEPLLVSNPNDVTLLYNLGTSYLKNNDYGNARLYLERASKISPLDPDISTNLEALQSKLNTDIVPIEPIFLIKWWHAIYNQLNPLTWSILSLTMGVGILLILFLSWVKKKNVGAKKWTIVLISLLLISICAGWSRNAHLNDKNAFVVFQSSNLKVSPSESSETIKLLSPGIKLIVIDQDGQWYKFKTLDLEEGWLKKSKVRQI